MQRAALLDIYTLPGQSLPHLDGQEIKLLFGLSTGCQQDLEV